MGRRGRRRNKQPLDDLEGKRRYCNFKEAALARSLWNLEDPMDL